MSTTERDVSSYVFQYRALDDLAGTFLPRNRRRQCVDVELMLLKRDSTISELQRLVADKDAAIERYMEENAKLRGWAGHVRTARTAATEAHATLQAAIDRPVPPAWRPGDAKAPPGTTTAITALALGGTLPVSGRTTVQR